MLPKLTSAAAPLEHWHSNFPSPGRHTPCPLQAAVGVPPSEVRQKAWQRVAFWVASTHEGGADAFERQLEVAMSVVGVHGRFPTLVK